MSPSDKFTDFQNILRILYFSGTTRENRLITNSSISDGNYCFHFDMCSGLRWTLTVHISQRRNDDCCKIKMISIEYLSILKSVKFGP